MSRQDMHERRAAALAERISERGREPTGGAVAEEARRARQSGQMPTVEAAAMDLGLVVDWWTA